MAIRYGGGAEPDPLAPFVGDDDFLSHLLRLARRPVTCVDLCFLPALTVAGQSRRSLAEQTERQVAAALSPPLARAA